MGNHEKKHIALYPGSFDGLTFGHLDIIERGARLFDLLLVAVARNEAKRPIFTVEERLEILRAETAHLENVRIHSFDGLTMDYAERMEASYVIRGIRVISDFEFELQMALMNRTLNPRVETLFMVPAAEHLYVSTTMIKEVLLLGGDVRRFVPETTETYLRTRFNIPKPEE